METSYALSKRINEDYFKLKESMLILIKSKKKRVINIETYQNCTETFTKIDDVFNNVYSSRIFRI